MKSDERQLKVLEFVVDIFIDTGEPVSSLAVCEKLENSVSSATIRNDMTKLEKLGYLVQPHTSAGRVPTYKGFRMYVDSLMKPFCLTDREKTKIDNMLSRNLTCVTDIVENGALALAHFTDLAVVSISSVRKFFVISKVEVIPAGRRVYAVLVVASSGEIKNKICRLNFDITDSQLHFFKKVINESLVGNTVEILDNVFIDNLVVSLGSYIYSLSPFLNALCDISSEILKRQVNFKGEENLLKYEGLKANELMEFMSAKSKIEGILSTAFSGVNILFGKEDDSFVVGNSSLIMAKYGSKEALGSFGVIGPIRLNYKKILPYVSYFSKSMTSLIEKFSNEIEGGGGCVESSKK